MGYAACQEGHSVLFADGIGVINDLSTAQKRGLLKRQLKKYLAPISWYWTKLATYRSTNMEPICSFKSSANGQHAIDGKKGADFRRLSVPDAVANKEPNSDYAVHHPTTILTESVTIRRRRSVFIRRQRCQGSEGILTPKTSTICLL